MFHICGKVAKANQYAFSDLNGYRYYKTLFNKVSGLIGVLQMNST